MAVGSNKVRIPWNTVIGMMNWAQTRRVVLSHGGKAYGEYLRFICTSILLNLINCSSILCTLDEKCAFCLLQTERPLYRILEKWKRLLTIQQVILYYIN